jgi:hypothetical protein
MGVHLCVCATDPYSGYLERAERPSIPHSRRNPRNATEFEGIYGTVTASEATAVCIRLSTYD